MLISSTLAEVTRQWASVQREVSDLVSYVLGEQRDADAVLQRVALHVFSYDFEREGWPKYFETWALGVARRKVVELYEEREAVSGEREGVRNSHEARAARLLIQRHARRMPMPVPSMTTTSQRTVHLRREATLAFAAIVSAGAVAVMDSRHGIIGL